MTEPATVFLCIQCRKCTAGCPVAESTDVPVNELVARVRLGEPDVELERLLALPEVVAQVLG